MQHSVMLIEQLCKTVCMYLCVFVVGRGDSGGGEGAVQTIQLFSLNLNNPVSHHLENTYCIHQDE